jgi:outer membrane receptor protein involved in Fe transport
VTAVRIAATTGVALVLALALPATTVAQPGDLLFDLDIEVPPLMLEELSDGVGGSDEALDLANIVQSAAKGITTVQEAPAIVTVIVADEIQDRGHRTIGSIADTAPGWMRVGVVHSQFPFPVTRGTPQSVLYLRDGVSMFDPFSNTPATSRIVPIETIKRIELITGPGGVLWGANSFLGILNVITKDAEDVDGVEASVSVGHGNGDREVLRGYVMAGLPRLWSRNSKLFVHSSFETYVGPGFEMPQHMVSGSLPQPNGNIMYGPLTRANPPRSFLFNLSGKLTVGDANVYFSVPFAEQNAPLGWTGIVTTKDIPEDTLTGADRPDLGLPPDQPLCPPGADDPLDPTGRYPCLDADRRNRTHRLAWLDRYVIGEYRMRTAGGAAGGTLKAYGVQFVRAFPQLSNLAAVPGLLPGGLAFEMDATSYRAGGAFDGDIDLPARLQLLYGAEGFYEWLGQTVDRSRQGPGVQATFMTPYELERLPLPCPVRRSGSGTALVEGCPLTFAFPASRSVFGAYVNPRWRATPKLTLDGGARAQVSPEALGRHGYPLVALYSAAVVYRFLPDWHAKLNYATGFRPPVFNNMVSNGEAISIAGRPDLDVEKSEAWQAEVNARIFKGERRIRELNFRSNYSYSVLQNLIQLDRGRYENVDDRGIHSAELLSKLYISGGHRVELSYTWLRIHTRDKGVLKTLPEHWFNLGGVFQVSSNLLASTNLRVLGSMEDPNRLIEYRGHAWDEFGYPTNTMTGAHEYIVSEPHQVVMDRIPASAELTAGLTWLPSRTFRLEAWVYNALNARNYQPDVFGDYEPRLEFFMNPYEDFRFIVKSTVNY